MDAFFFPVFKMFFSAAFRTFGNVADTVEMGSGAPMEESTTNVY